MAVVSSGRIPKELWTKYILKQCDALALLKLEKASRFFYFHVNTCSDCDYSLINHKTVAPDELELRFIRSFACKNVWTRRAANYVNRKFGGNLPCRITKHLLAREELRKVMP